MNQIDTMQQMRAEDLPPKAGVKNVFTGSVNRALEAVAKVMSEVGSVEKKGVNEFHRYSYATAADVMHKLQPLIAKNGLTILQHQKSLSFLQEGAAMAIEYEFHVLHQSGDSLPLAAVHTGVAAARTSKGSPDDKAANKCHTAARKYFLLSLFQIPTGDYDDPDADGDVPEKKEQKAKNESAAIKAAAEQKPKEQWLLLAADGSVLPFGTRTAYLDQLEKAIGYINDASDKVAMFDANAETIGRIQSDAIALKSDKGDKMAKRITDLHAMIHALANDIPNPLAGG